MTCPVETVCELVRDFESRRCALLSSTGNRTRLAREFVAPLFVALGWDMSQFASLPTTSHVRAIYDVAAAEDTDATPDYCFYVGRAAQFRLRISRPVDEREAPSDCVFKLCRSGWCAGLTLSILTNFDQFAVFDCRDAPYHDDAAASVPVFSCSYKEYAVNWKYIASLLSREAVSAGSIDAYARSSALQRSFRTDFRADFRTIEQALFEHMGRWEKDLAEALVCHASCGDIQARRTIAKRVIDGIVILLVCEGRRVEPHGQLRRIVDKPDLCYYLGQLWRRANAKYGAVFFPSDIAIMEHASGAEAVLRGIVSDLYRPDSLYDFSALPVGILGKLYEMSLGKSVSTAAKHGANAHLTSTRQKSAGVYYTPAGIVDYILDETLQPLIDAATCSKQLTTLRVLDPACGSGVFLLEAYQRLLDWHLAWYIERGPARYARGENRALVRDARGNWHLTPAKRKEILCQSIFGVDIDPDAVELTKLLLILKALERDWDRAGDHNLCLFEHETAPALDHNIQCGNSLVDAAHVQVDDAPVQALASRPFDWHKQFSSVFRDGGFDLVVGNPPYLSYGGRQAVALSNELRRYFEEHYECAGWPTSHSFFIERCTKLLSRKYVSFIVPDQVGHLEGYRSLRKLMATHGELREVRYWGEKVFAGVTTPALTFVWEKKPGGDTGASGQAAARIITQDGAAHIVKLDRDGPWTPPTAASNLVRKLSQRSFSVRPFVSDCGVRTTSKRTQVVPIDQADGEYIVVVEGKQIGRYWCASPTVAIRLDRGTVLRSRDEKYRGARFLIRQTASYPIVGPHNGNSYFRNSVHGLYEPDNGLDIRYVVGLLNSKVLRFAYVTLTREARQRAFPQVKLAALGKLPLRQIDRTAPEEVARHDRIVTLVDQLLEGNRDMRTARDPRDRQALEQRLRSIDNALDVAIYELYGLTETEVEQVESLVASLPAAP